MIYIVVVFNIFYNNMIKIVNIEYKYSIVLRNTILLLFCFISSIFLCFYISFFQNNKTRRLARVSPKGQLLPAGGRVELEEVLDCLAQKPGRGDGRR